MAPRCRSSAHRLAAAGLLVAALCLAARPALAARATLLHAASSTGTSGGRALTAVVDQLPCAKTGGPAGPTWMNASATCMRFWPAPSAPIVLPADNATLKYGQLYIASDDQDAAVSVFVDRNGAQYNISASANPPQDALELQRIWTMLIVQATVDPSSGNVTSFTPILYVPFSTLMATMENTQFEGQLYNSEPRPVGPNETSWIRWTFGSVITVDDPTMKYDTLLYGTWDNLFDNVVDSTGTCRPAMCEDPTASPLSSACQYYQEFFGSTSNAMTLNWDPNMHTPTDTELVPMFPAFNRQYMSTFIELYQLLQPYSFVPREYVFISHGNPMGVPQNFTGTLKPASTPLKLC